MGAPERRGASSFVDGWLLAHALGEGAYGEVRLLVNKATGEAVAMKAIDLRRRAGAADAARKETAAQRALRHPHVLRLYGQRSHADFEYLFLEYCSGGELFDRIEPDRGMPAAQARRYFRQLLAGVEHMHERGIAHRDIKPENLLLDDKDALKISDFGMATMFRYRDKERELDRKCGTLPYVAPEVLTGPYRATPADLWSCGIVLVAMLAGELPWDQPSPTCDEFKMWCMCSITEMGGLWRNIPAGPLGLLKNLLAPDPKKRSTMQRLKDNRWLIKSQAEDDFVRNSDGVCLSQPLPSSDYTASLMVEIENDILPCFSQPVVVEDLMLSTQLNPTQSSTASQGVFQKFVKRMTRFFVSCEWSTAVDKLGRVLHGMQCQWKVSQGKGITITTIDSRKMQLVFKANFIDMDGKLLIDFRLSKGCGIEFKRKFVLIKKGLSEVIVKGPTTAAVLDVPVF